MLFPMPTASVLPVVVVLTVTLGLLVLSASVLLGLLMLWLCTKDDGRDLEARDAAHWTPLASVCVPMARP